MKPWSELVKLELIVDQNLRSMSTRQALRTGARRVVNLPSFVWRMRRLGLLPAALELHQIYRALDYSPASVDFAARCFSEGDFLAIAPLDEKALVVDVGAYRGEWAEQIKRRYGCAIHCFEPNPADYPELARKFQGDARVVCHPYGLAARDGSAELSEVGMGSSIYAESPLYAGSVKHRVELRDVVRVFAELGLEKVSLLKVNIEGGEYELLDRLIAEGLHVRCDCIRVQFHRWFDGASRRRKVLQRALGRTHRVEWDFPFVWESWIKC